MFRRTYNAAEHAHKGMLLASIVRRARTLRNLCYVREYEAASRMAEFRIDPSSVVYQRGTRVYRVPELGINLAPAHHCLLRALWQAFALKRAGVWFSNDGTEIIAHTPSFSVTVENEDELFILREVVANGIYNVVPGTPDVVVLDVGMNAGFASLQFAAQPWVAAVWAYEPVPETFARGLRNLERNPELAMKIKPHDYGLSDASGKMTFDYSPAWRGAAGLHGLTPGFRRNHRISSEEVSQVTVEVREASDVVREVRHGCPNASLILKLDCEGSEYPIIAALKSAGLLGQVDAFLIEWHERGAADLIETLTTAGFFALSLTPRESTGMIYACNRNEG
jgi:FkbM family methyltransferase